MANRLIIREYGCIYKGMHSRQLDDFNIELAQLEFEYLKNLLLRDDPGNDEHQHVFRLTIQSSTEVLKVQNYVGVIETNRGTQIEILPKLFVANTSVDSPEHSRRLLLKMLRCVKALPFRSAGSATIDIARLPLLEIFISEFLNEVNLLVKKGVKFDYVTVKDELPYLKGKLNLNRQIRRNFIKQHKFHNEYDEYITNRSENRLIKTALELVKKVTVSAINQRLANELLFVFHEVPLSKDVEADFSTCKRDRAMTHYQTTMLWCRAILRKVSPFASKGGLSTISILFPMERLFEDYVGNRLVTKYTGWDISKQSKSKYLLYQSDNTRWFQLKPDFLIDDGDSKFIADTKWKLIDKSDKTNKYGVSQSDIYQMFAYGHKYLSSQSDKTVILIYPKTDTFDCPLPEFSFDGDFKLLVIPYDLDNDVLMFPLNDSESSFLIAK